MPTYYLSSTDGGITNGADSLSESVSASDTQNATTFLLLTSSVNESVTAIDATDGTIGSITTKSKRIDWTER